MKSNEWMTSEWMTSVNPYEMMTYLTTKTVLSPRKISLLCCALCRHPMIWSLIAYGDDNFYHNAIEVVELYADELVTIEQHNDAVAASNVHYLDMWRQRIQTLEADNARQLLYAFGAANCCMLLHKEFSILYAVLVHVQNAGMCDKDQAKIIRHIIGNVVRPTRWPCDDLHDDIQSMALEMYLGNQKIRGPLCDRLQKVNAPKKLWKHFWYGECSKCQGTGMQATCPCEVCHGSGMIGHDHHPKGCWAMDALLGKTV